MTVTSTSRVATERGERYRKQLASHFGNKVEVVEEPSGTVLKWGFGGTTTLTVEVGALVMRADADDADTLDRGVHRVHAFPGRHGQALEDRTVPGLDDPGGDQRRRGRPDRGDHDHRAGQQVHRGRVADRASHPGPGAAVRPGAPHLRPDRRAARAGQDAETAVEAEVAGRGDRALRRP